MHVVDINPYKIVIDKLWYTQNIFNCNSKSCYRWWLSGICSKHVETDAVCFSDVLLVNGIWKVCITTPCLQEKFRQILYIWFFGHVTIILLANFYKWKVLMSSFRGTSKESPFSLKDDFINQSVSLSYLNVALASRKNWKTWMSSV